MDTFLDPAPAAIAAFLARDLDAPVVMLNLLRFRGIADYSSAPDLAGLEVTGRQAYETYLEHTVPFCDRYGGEVLYRGRGAGYLIGPTDETWHEVLLVRYPSSRAFLGLAQDPKYLEIAGHRTAALQDSRLLPLDDVR